MFSQTEERVAGLAYHMSRRVRAILTTIIETARYVSADETDAWAKLLAAKGSKSKSKRVRCYLSSILTDKSVLDRLVSGQWSRWRGTGAKLRRLTQFNCVICYGAVSVFDLKTATASLKRMTLEAGSDNAPIFSARSVSARWCTRVRFRARIAARGNVYQHRSNNYSNTVNG